MRLKTKMLLFLVPAIIIILACISIYNQFNARAQAQAFALQQAVGIAAKESGPLLERLQQAQAMTKAMVSTMARLKAEEKTDRVYLRELVAGVAAAEQGFVGAWMLWEPNAFDGKDADFVDNEEYGNKEGRANAFWMTTTGALEYDVSNDYDGEKYYTVPKAKGKICVLPPYIDHDTPTKIFMTSIAMPIIVQGKFCGVGGVDIELKTLSSIIAKAKPYGTGYAMLASDTGVIVGSPRMEDVGKNIADVLSAETIADMKKAGEAGQQVDAHVSEVLLQEQAEKDLYAAMQTLVPQANAQFNAGNYTASLQTLAALRTPVDTFFDDVMVNAEQMDLRLNRLGLLKALHMAMNRVADLARLAAWQE